MLDRGAATEHAASPTDVQRAPEVAGNEVYTAEQWQIAGTLLQPAIAAGPGDLAALLRRRLIYRGTTEGSGSSA